jgi:hypothetical protein
MSGVGLGEAMRRLAADYDLISARTGGLSDDELVAPYRTDAGPLGDFCESLSDLVAHLLTWAEINLAVLTEARAGREHWSLDPRWEQDEAGRRINRAGVIAGRHLTPGLLRHRLTVAQHATLDELARYDEASWAAPGTAPWLAGGMAGLAERVWTVPGHPPYRHAALHLRVPVD